MREIWSEWNEAVRLKCNEDESLYNFRSVAGEIVELSKISLLLAFDIIIYLLYQKIALNTSQIAYSSLVPDPVGGNPRQTQPARLISK